MTRRSHPRRDIAVIPNAERSAQLWLTVDDVLERVALSRSSFWRKVMDCTFPAPYMWKGTPLWTQADLRDWINQCVRGNRAPVSERTPVTWDSIAELMRSKSPAGFTNKQIAHLLDAEEADTMCLTRIMAKAGVLASFQPTSNSPAAPKFYTYLESDISRFVPNKSGLKDVAA